MAAPQASSRLELLQARFQQKQLQEKEQKLLQLYDQQQQRAYQVVQRGSAGSNGSSYGSSVSQHTIAKASTNSHTTSTSQGGKVRQMFDERRQTTVKGVDRSYPLEPLENKPRKQTNGNVQKNGNSSVNRHSVTVKRVARADVNSNLNAGKPIVSYHEEITRESFDPSSGRQQSDDDEFGNENHVLHYANGNHREEIQIEEALDEDTIERNRMMAKLHLMQYDETLKHRIKNDLESEEFPEDFMVDVPDKLPKQSISKKLSQAEARLERFRNANAKRISNATKNTSLSQVPKKRAEAGLPGKGTSSKGKTRNASERLEEMLSSSDSERTVKRRVCYEESDSSRNGRFRSRSPKFFCKESEQSATTYAIDSKTGVGARRSSTDFSSDRSRSGSPRFFCKESEKSTTNYAIDAKIGLGSKTTRRLSPDFSSDRSRSGSPQFFCKESEKSATTYAIDSKGGLGLKGARRSSPNFSRDRGSQSGSPKFFCKESDKSATTYAIDTKSKQKLTSDLSKNRSIVKIKPENEFINKISRKLHATTDDTVDRYIKDHDLDKVRTPSPTVSLKNDTSRIKIDGKIDSKSTRTGPTNIFERLTRDRSSSPQFLHQESRKSPISITSSKRRDFVSKSPDNILKNRGYEKISSEKHGFSHSRTTTSKSPDFVKTLRKSNASPQYCSDRSATIMFVTPETITKTKAGYSKPVKKAQSPTLSIRKADTTNRMIDSRRRKSVENVDENSKQRIRSSVSRYFEQCEKATRNEEAGARNKKSQSARNAEASRASSPVSLKHMEAVISARKSPQLYREAPGKFIATNVVRSRSGTPEFFCYETDKMATTVSLKPGLDAGPETVRSGSRLSKSSDTYATIKSVNDNSRSSSPLGTRYMTDKDKRILSIFPFKSEQPKCSKHSKSPLSTNKFILSKGKSSKSSDAFDKDRKSIGTSRRITPSASPEFFCYETDKMATTVSLKPRPSKDSRDYFRSPEPLRTESILSKSPDTSKIYFNTSRSSSPVLSQYSTDSDRATPRFFSSKNDKPNSTKDLSRKHSKGNTSKNSNVFNLPNDTKSNSRSHNASPSPRKGSRSPDFFCYETEKSATTVNLRGSSKSSKSTGLADSVSKGRSSKSPEQSTKDPKGRRGSGNVLRSTRLIRDIIKHQRNRESDCGSWKDSAISGRKERASSVGDVGLKQRSKIGSNRNIVDRATTPTTYSRCKLPGEASPKSGTFAEMNSEIQEITVTDRYAKQDRIQLRGTYSKSSKTSSNSKRLDTFASSLTKQARNKRPPLDSIIFSSYKRDRRLVESRREMDSCSENTTVEDTVGLANPSESLRSGVQTASLSKQSPTLGSIELVRKVVKSGSKAPGKTLKTREADEQEGTQRRPSNSVSGAAAVNDGRSSSKNYERTDSVESALRRFDSIDTEAGVESVQGTLQESVTEKRQTPEESRAEGSAADNSSTISLKALDKDANPSGAEREPSPTRSKRTSSRSSVASRARVLKKEENRQQKKITKIRDPSEIFGRVRSLTCRRRLVQDNDLETRSSRKFGPNNEATGLAKSGSKKANKPSTGASDLDLSLSVKQLRSIENIRKSFGDISSDREEARAKSAIASNNSRTRSGKPRVSSSVACDRIEKESLAKRSENVGASRDSERFVKSATRFSRVVKSPSLDSKKAIETNSRTGRSVLSPSKSPDIVTRRSSTELKASDTARSTKRTTPTKDAEPIGKRKTTTTTRKSTDVVDGATVLENGLHLQDQTVETKYDNDPQTSKKTFVIDYEEQPTKENNGPLPRKPLLKKPSIEKQTPSTPMQASTSNPKSKMTLRAKTTSSSSRSSASSKSGSNCTPDLLVPCKICGRSFAQDRVTLHEQICSKTGQKRRKLFDSVMSRVKGTELEKFVKKGCAKKQPEKPPEPKSNWRRKHEDFINAIRSAKQVQAHLAAGGKLSDLPPPPPSDTSDYIQCPHCGRKFNKSAAERHIPKCEHMLHNKPIHSRAPKPRR